MGWIFPASFGLFFFVIGMGFTFMGVGEVWRAGWSATWPTTPATITRSDIVRSSNDSGDDFVPEIEYRYAVDGKDFTSKGFRLGTKVTYNRKKARSVADRYPVGEAVMIAYDANNPANALLEPGLHKQTFVMPIFGSVFAAAGAAFMAFIWCIAQ